MSKAESIMVGMLFILLVSMVLILYFKNYINEIDIFLKFLLPLFFGYILGKANAR